MADKEKGNDIGFYLIILAIVVVFAIIRSLTEGGGFVGVIIYTLLGVFGIFVIYQIYKND